MAFLSRIAGMTALKCLFRCRPVSLNKTQGYLTQQYLGQGTLTCLGCQAMRKKSLLKSGHLSYQTKHRWQTSNSETTERLLDSVQLKEIISTNQKSFDINQRVINHVETNTLASNNPSEDMNSQGRLLTSEGYLFGVFDGHGGNTCSKFVCEYLLSYMAVCLTSQEQLNLLFSDQTFDVNVALYDGLIDWLGGCPSYVSDELNDLFNENLHILANDCLIMEQDDVHVENRIKIAFEQLDSDLTNVAPPETLSWEGRRLLLQAAFSGSCATVAYINDSDLYVANVGDSRAVLGTVNERGKMEAKQITRDHNTQNIDEVRRISVEHPNEFPTLFADDRLLGMLAPLRAFGDVRFKWTRKDLKRFSHQLFGDSPENNQNFIIPTNYRTPPYLSARPDVFHRRLSRNDKFVVLATDGLWDMLSPQRVVTIIHEHREYLQAAALDNNRTINGENGVMGDKDQNCATYLIRNALGKSDKHVSMFLTLPDDVVRHYRDDITITVIYFNDDFLNNYS